jgi:hypothetical protein
MAGRQSASFSLLSHLHLYESLVLFLAAEIYVVWSEPTARSALGMIEQANNTKAASYETASVMVPGKARNVPVETLCAILTVLDHSNNVP